MSLTTTDASPKRVALLSGDDLIDQFELPVGNHLATSLTVIAAEDESEWLGALPPAAFPALPAAGTWLEIGAVYSYGDGCVMVRQSHTRTEHDPADVPALFVVHREDATGLDWIAGEPVTVGTVRVFDGLTYRALQAHVTQVDWTPPATPALWALVEDEEPPAEQPAEWVQPTGAHDAYQIGDLVTFNGQVYRSKINANVWSPAVYPAGWELIPWP